MPLPVSLMVGTRIGDDENAERRAAEDQEFERLDQRVQMAAERGIAAEHAADRNDQADDEIQGLAPLGWGLARH